MFFLEKRDKIFRLYVVLKNGITTDKEKISSKLTSFLVLKNKSEVSWDSTFSDSETIIFVTKNTFKFVWTMWYSF